MNNIYDPNDSFSFDKLKISKPVSILGGNYFIKFSLDNNPLYIQPPKCKTKQGFLKAGKRFYTDLVFTNENDEFIRWMENLENVCHKHLFNNRDKWFESDMELHDIENYFTAPLKIYKTGKFYLARVNILTNLGVPNLTIYNENNNEVQLEDINDKTDVITIIELKGIKCTTTSFQIEMEMKQMLTIKPVELFKKCVIKMPIQNATLPNPDTDTDTDTYISPEHDNKINTDTYISPDPDNEPNTDTNILPESVNEIIEESTNDNATLVENEEIFVNTDDHVNNTDDHVNNTDDHANNTDDHANNTDDHANNEVDPNIIAEVTTLPNLSYQNTELEEVEIHLDELPEQANINIRNSNEVYYEMYREACRKAKIARDLALSSYLEAKRIKNTYMLEDITDSDDSDLEQETESIE
tara:strand:- start:7340 stop:8575 length:1236 start_codon:yes stop_codon:yes gene_type:complete